jgi:hypothetical protein
LAFRAAFREAAMAAAEAGRGLEGDEILAEGEQGTPQWLQLRETRLTASAFNNALGCEFCFGYGFLRPLTDWTITFAHIFHFCQHLQKWENQH